MKSKTLETGETIRGTIFRQTISFAFGEQRALAASRFRWTGEPRWCIDLFSGVPSPQTQSNCRCRLKVYISPETDTFRYSYNTQFDQGILRSRIHTLDVCSYLQRPSTEIDEQRQKEPCTPIKHATRVCVLVIGRENPDLHQFNVHTRTTVFTYTAHYTYTFAKARQKRVTI